MPSLFIGLAFLVALGGCDSKINLNECEGTTSPPTSDDYLDLNVGTAVVDGPEDERLNPDGRLELPARVDFAFESERQLVVLGAPDGSLPQITVGSIDPDTLEAGDEVYVGAGYNVSGSREEGSGRLRVTSVSSDAIEGTFAGCVRLENQAIPLYGPYRTVRGGFNATRD